MGHVWENKIRRDQVVSSICVLLENQGIDSGFDWCVDPDNMRNLNGLVDLSPRYTVYSGDLGITQDEDETKILFCVGSNDPDFLQQKLSQEIGRALKEQGTKKIQLVFFVRDMRSRISLETELNTGGLNDLYKAAQETAHLEKKKFKLFANYVLLQEYASQDVRLTNLRPLEMLHEPPVDRDITMETKPKEVGSIQARVFTVDLYQLAQLYNLIGDTLFQNNVRFGINEVLGVEQSMQETLRSKPEHFWFKNNGVTFLIQNSHTFLQEARTVLLGRLDPNKPLPFSVINGAQTITTAAQFFFKMEAMGGKKNDAQKILDVKAGKENDPQQILENAKKNARVLVRVINKTDKGNEDVDQLYREISVALNRQKPIRMDNIAFTHPAVRKLANYLSQMEKPPFLLVRQGETVANNKTMDLISFARVRMACVGRPGMARTKGRSKLLELKTNEDGSTRFAQTELFSSQWLEAEDAETEDAIFQKDYRAIWFTYQLAKDYEIAMRKFESDSTNILNAIRNGKWYFVAIVTQIMNTFRPDYSEFSAGTLSNLPRLMEALAQLMISETKAMGKEKEINSNLFKTDELYNRIIEKLRKNPSVKSLSNPVSETQIFSLISAERFPPLIIIKIFSSYVILNQQHINVPTDAQALAEIAKHILTVYPAAETALLNQCGKWFTRADCNSPESKGTFMVKGKLFHVDANANKENKCRRMEKMCKIANVERGTIKWHKYGEQKFTFSW